jgi:hypothetical protein
MFVAVHVKILVILSFVRNAVYGNIDSSTAELVADYFAHKRVRVVRSFACKQYGRLQKTNSLAVGLELNIKRRILGMDLSDIRQPPERIPSVVFQTLLLRDLIVCVIWCLSYPSFLYSRS